MRIVLAILAMLIFQSALSQVGIGTPNPNPAAQLEISSSDKGVLLPRLTTAQRNAVQNPPRGLLIFNITTNKLEVFTGVWTVASALSESVAKNYGGDRRDVATAVIQTADGGYAIAGFTETDLGTGVRSDQFYILKLNSSGNLIWENKWGGDRTEVWFSITESADQGIVVCGNSNSGATVNQNGYVEKYGYYGNRVWSTYVMDAGVEELRAIHNTSDGGYIVAGSSSSTGTNGSTDFHIIKLDADGNIVWRKWYGGSSAELALSVKEVFDKGFIVCGYSSSTNITGATNKGGNDIYITKLDSSGNHVWSNMYGGAGADIGYSIEQTSDSGYVIAGSSTSVNIPGIVNNGGLDYYVLKIYASGKPQWQRTFGGSNAEEALSVREGTDGNYIVTGYSLSTNISGTTANGLRDIYTLKLDPAGNIIWQKLLGGSGHDDAYAVTIGFDGAYILAGSTGSPNIPGIQPRGISDVYIVKLDLYGNPL